MLQLKELHSKGSGGVSIKNITAKEFMTRSELAVLNLINWYQQVKSELLKSGGKFTCLFQRWKGILMIRVFNDSIC
jgi:hypothetical protein